MDLPWQPLGEEAKATPPWIRHCHLQTQQELCAKRFLRFASQRTVHAVLVLWALASWRSGLCTLEAWAPVMYFTAPVLLKHRVLPKLSVEHLSVVILALNLANALHLALLFARQGPLIFTSPLCAAVALCRLLFGLFTQKVHVHMLLSSSLTLVALQATGTSFILLLMTCLLLELTAVAVFSGGPCGYEEAMVHLAQLRLQHQLARSQALQQIDVEREELSGQLLSIAAEGIAELTASVQRASEPVLNMLKSSCATGTKSSSEAERIGRIGKALQSEVGELLRYKTEATWQRLQQGAKERMEQLEGYSLEQQVLSDAILKSLQKGIGPSLAEIHKLELEAETSMAQLVHGEVKRALEIADARMDLVRHSAEAMERRVSDTVEVLLSLLKYFRSKGSCDEKAEPKHEGRRAPRMKEVTAAQSVTPMQTISEAAPQSDSEEAEDVRLSSTSEEGGEWPPADQETRPLPGGRRLLLPRRRFPEPPSPSPPTTPTTSSGSSGLESKEKAASSSGQSTTAGSMRMPASQSEAPFTRGGVCVPREVIERHPLFATRLCYRSEDFFFSWASSADFRAEADALRQWRRAATLSAGEMMEGEGPLDAGLDMAPKEVEKRCWTGKVKAEENSGTSE